MIEINKILESKLFRAIILGIAGLILLSFAFGLGIYVGERKAEFSFRWADQYHANFAGPKKGFLGNMMEIDGGFANSNGVFGQVIKIDIPADEKTSSTLIIKDNKDNTEKIVSIQDRTAIKKQNKDIKLSDIKINDTIIVIGEPDSNGQIKAELIRVMPSIPNQTNGSLDSVNGASLQRNNFPGEDLKK